MALAAAPTIWFQHTNPALACITAKGTGERDRGSGALCCLPLPPPSLSLSLYLRRSSWEASRLLLSTGARLSCPPVQLNFFHSKKPPAATARPIMGACSAATSPRSSGSEGAAAPLNEPDELTCTTSLARQASGSGRWEHACALSGFAGSPTRIELAPLVRSLV